MCKIEGRLGGGAEDLQEVKLLSRIVRWTPEGRLREADPRHAEQLLRDLLESARGRPRDLLSGLSARCRGRRSSRAS
eukprot:5314678-Alexandrium_andersonii.AAC.1